MDYDAETSTHRSYYTVHGQRCWNTEEVVTQSVVNDAETQKKLLHSPWSTMLKHRRSCYTVHGRWCWNIEEAVIQSVVDDAETQKKLLHSPWSTILKHRGSYYTVRGQRCWTTTHTDWLQQLHREPSINHRCFLRSAETIRTQIPWLKQPWICNAKTTYKNSNKKQIKKLLLQPEQQTPH